MPSDEKIMLKDIQKSADERGIDIQHVGIKDACLPFRIKTKAGDFQQVVAHVLFTVSLPKEYKGTHMSRFLEILQRWCDKPVAEEEMEAMLQDALNRLEAETAKLRLSFKYFVEKEAPKSKRTSVLDLDCFFEGEKRIGAPMAFRLGVTVPATSLCPCSKAIANYGAHNQRSLLQTVVEFRPSAPCIFIEDLAALMEAQASCPIYPLLKREDEKYVTEKAYEQPKFVEDILRDVVLALRSLPEIFWFSIACENFESIHNHSAYASHEEYVGDAMRISCKTQKI